MFGIDICILNNERRFEDKINNKIIKILARHDDRVLRFQLGLRFNYFTYLSIKRL